MAIAVERYLAITQLIRDRFRLTARRLTAVIIIGWTFAVIYNMPLFLVVELNNDGGNQCTEHWCPNENLGKAFFCQRSYSSCYHGDLVFESSLQAMERWHTCNFIVRASKNTIKT